MKILTYCLLTSMVACVFVLCSCSGTPYKETHYSSVERDKLKYKNVLINNLSVSEDMISKVPSQFITEMPLYCAKELIKSNVFENVLFDTKLYSNESTLIVQSELVDIRIVSSTARIWLGVLVGISTMTINVKLIEAGTNIVISEKTFNEGSFSTVPRAIVKDYSLHELLCIQMADYIIEIAKK